MEQNRAIKQASQVLEKTTSQSDKTIAKLRDKLELKKRQLSESNLKCESLSLDYTVCQSTIAEKLQCMEELESRFKISQTAHTAAIDRISSDHEREVGNLISKHASFKNGLLESHSRSLGSLR